METPGTLEPNVPVQSMSIPPGKPVAGTGTARPVRKISSSPFTGTIVTHVLVIVLNVVELQLAVGENVIWALGAEFVNSDPFCIDVIFELLKVITAPVLGIPFAVKLALNHTHLPEEIGVPLKLDTMLVCAEQGGGGGGAHVRLDGEMLTELNEPLYPGNVVLPENEKLPFKSGNEPVTIWLNALELAVKGIDPVIGKPLELGELSNVY